MRRGRVIASKYRSVVATALTEVALLAVCWQVYKYGRYLVRDQRVAAFENASDVIAIERRLSLFVEPQFQQLAMASRTVMEALNRYYVYTHVALTLACLCWLYGWHRPHYRSCRRVLLAVMAVGLAIHAVYPLAPPRFVPEAAMVDTLAEFGPAVYSQDRFASITNQFAAMPSFHVGWSVFVAYYVIAHCRSRLRWVALVHPTVMTFAVMATANHYFLDALVGAALTLGGIYAEDRLRSGSRQADRPLPARITTSLRA